MKRSVSIVVSLGCVLITMAAQAAVNIGPEVIVRGTDIEVVGPGPDLQGIIDSITDATVDKPYSIKLGPGKYTLTPLSGDPGIRMKRYISIIGSGQGVTVLSGALSAGSSTNAGAAIVQGASNAALTDLTVVNTGLGVASVGIYNLNASPRIERVTVTASFGTDNTGVYNEGPSSPTLTQVTARAVSGTGSNRGVFNTGSSLPNLTQVTAIGEGGSGSAGVVNFSASAARMTHVIAMGSNATGSNIGVLNQNTSKPTLTHVIATGRGGSTAYGVWNLSSSAPTLTHVIATGEDGTTNYGVYSDQNTVVLAVDASVLTGTTAAMRFGGNAATRIANSHVNGPVLNNPGGVQCGGVYNVNLSLVSC